MPKNGIFVRALWCITFLSSANASQIEKFSHDYEARQHLAKEASENLAGKKYKFLDETAALYQKNRTRTPGGSLASAFFYGGIDTALKGKDEAGWRGNFKAIEEWRAARPESAVAILALASMHINYGWYFRGDGTAKTVSAENWEKFNAQVAHAKKILMENKEIATFNPEWYRLMLVVARAEGWSGKETSALVAEGLRRYPYYQPIYFGFVEYLAPKWHGSPERLEEFAQQARDLAESGESNGIYARICVVASKTYYKEEIFRKSLCNWSIMKSGFQEIENRFPDPYNMNNYAQFACLAGDQGAAEPLFRKIGEAPIKEAWFDMKIFNACHEWITKVK